MLLSVDLISVKLFEYKSVNPESHVSNDDDGGVEKPAFRPVDVFDIMSMSAFILLGTSIFVDVISM